MSAKSSDIVFALERITTTFHQPGKRGASEPDASTTTPGGGVLGGKPSQLVALARGVPVDAVARHFDHERAVGSQVRAQVKHALQSMSTDDGREVGSGLDVADVGVLQQFLLRRLLQLLLHDSIVSPHTASHKTLTGPVEEQPRTTHSSTRDFRKPVHRLPITPQRALLVESRAGRCTPR